MHLVECAEREHHVEALRRNRAVDLESGLEEHLGKPFVDPCRRCPERDDFLAGDVLQYLFGLSQVRELEVRGHDVEGDRKSVV